jgi:hypothetical protein
MVRYITILLVCAFELATLSGSFLEKSTGLFENQFVVALFTGIGMYCSTQL